MATKKPAGKSTASPLVKKPYYGKGSLFYSLEHGEAPGAVKKPAATAKSGKKIAKPKKSK